MLKENFDVNQFLHAIEILNSQNMALIESEEYVEGQKILNWKKIVKNHQVIKKFKDFFLHKKAKAVEMDAKENLDEETWKKLLHLGNPEKKVVVYSCVTGDYDEIKEPLIVGNNVKYVMYTDKKMKFDKSSWNFCEIPEIGMFDNCHINRYLKMHPFELFASEYDYCIYIDGNVQPISDISVLSEMIHEKIGISIHKHRYRDCVYDEEQVCEWKGKGNVEKMRLQVEKYKKYGLPLHFGLGECTVIVTDLKNEIARDIYIKWWDEYLSSGSYRDQLSLPYIIWKMGLKMNDICSLGNNLYRNRKIRVYSH